MYKGFGCTFVVVQLTLRDKLKIHEITIRLFFVANHVAHQIIVGKNYIKNCGWAAR